MQGRRMTRLIDADRLKERFRLRTLESKQIAYTSQVYVDVADFMMVLDEVKQAPTVDAIPIDWINWWLSYHDSWNREGVVSLVRDWQDCGGKR